MEKKITKDMIIEDIVNKYPEAANVMTDSGMHCIGCSVAASETLENGAKSHGISDGDIDKMVETINDIINKEEPKETKDDDNE